jgi:hypothetical protein
MGLLLFFCGKRKVTKRIAMSRLTLRVAASVGARGNSPAFRQGQTGLRADPVRRVDAYKGEKPKTPTD